MKELKVGNLIINVVDKGSKLKIFWRGTSEMRDPGELLSPFLQNLAETAKNMSIEIDFCDLEYMNSATVGPIVIFIRLLEAQQLATRIIYDSSKSFQKTVFRSIQALAHLMRYIKVDDIEGITIRREG